MFLDPFDDYDTGKNYDNDKDKDVFVGYFLSLIYDFDEHWISSNG